MASLRPGTRGSSWRRGYCRPVDAAAESGALYDAASRQHIRVIAGGVSRLLFAAHDLLERRRAGVATMRNDLRETLYEEAWRWLNGSGMTTAEKVAVAEKAWQAAAGKLPWTEFKSTYDAGILTRLVGHSHVSPISPVAAAVLMAVAAPFRADNRRSLQAAAWRGSAERAIELERQLGWFLTTPSESLTCPTLTMRWRTGPALTVRVDGWAVFSGDDWRVVHQDDALRVAFAPRGSNFAVDGALFPPLPQPGAAREPILLFEASVTSPTESGRVAKAARWFAPGQLVSRVKAAFPGQPIRILLLWPELAPALPVPSAM